MLKHTVISILFACLSFGTISVASADIRIATWNIQHLGWGENKNYQVLGAIGGLFDFLAIQEAMTEDGLVQFTQSLEETTGVEWHQMSSHPIGRGSHEERYAFVWRADRVEYLDGAVVFLDTTDRFAREPYSARFRVRASGETFVAATVHILYGESVGDRTPEIKALRAYWDWLEEVYPGEAKRRLLLGDFNLAPSNKAWAALREVAEPLVSQGATTLSSIDGRFANLYDNIWVSRDHALDIREAGIFDYPAFLEQVSERDWTHDEARRHVSDHAPVYVLLGETELTLSHVDEETLDLDGRGCIDLNEVSVRELERIVHIGPARAQDIKEGRPWASMGDLRRVSGIGPSRLDDIRAQGALCVD